jgi:MSHA biogenesis protein MshQ
MSLVLKAVEDGDGVSDDGSAVSLTPVGSEIRFGRLVVDDAYGPQTRDLPVPVRAEYYDGGDFIDNADDYCTTIAPLTAGSLDNWQGNLVEGETDLSDSSGLLLAGSGEIVLSAPGAGTDGDTNDGSVDLTLDLTITDIPQEWLLNDQDSDGLYEENPFGTASFGMYRGDDRFIYWRESP